MVGITNRAFRSLLAETGGPDFAFTEMASAEAYISHTKFESVYTDTMPSPAAVSVQFYARSPESLARACAETAARPPEERPAGIDINFGCSAPHIRKSGGGSAWSENPEGAARLVTAARSAWPGSLSAKLRMGPDDDYDRLLDFCRRLAGEGLDFLTLHPRTDSQKFRRLPRHDITVRLAADLEIPVIANGDIRSPGDAALLLSRGAWAVMIGREAVRSPWIFSFMRRTPVRADRKNLALRYLDLAEAHLPEEWRMESARRFFEYYSETMSFAHHFKYSLINAKDLAAMRTALADYFQRVETDRMIVLP
jgi:tRNA-dihydrouridine synthase